MTFPAVEPSTKAAFQGLEQNLSPAALRRMPREMMLAILADARTSVIEADAICHAGATDHIAIDGRAKAFYKWQRAVRLWNLWSGLR